MVCQRCLSVSICFVLYDSHVLAPLLLVACAHNLCRRCYNAFYEVLARIATSYALFTQENISCRLFYERPLNDRTLKIIRRSLQCRASCHRCTALRMRLLSAIHSQTMNWASARMTARSGGNSAFLKTQQWTYSFRQRSETATHLSLTQITSPTRCPASSN